MPPVGQFDALEDSSDDEPPRQDSIQVPSHEDLSLTRTDEETVLTAVYGEDFSRETGVWGCAKLSVHVRPPDIQREHVGSELTLSAQLAKQYPYVSPKMELCHVTGLSKNEQKDLMCQLEKRAQECASVGSVMMCELVQVVEDFLLAHNRNPNMSEWEQMKAREALQQQEEERAKRDQEKELKRIMMEEHDKTDEYSHDRINASGGEVEREMARQMEALAEADRKRREFKTISSNDEGRDEDDDESENEFVDDNDYPTITAGSSRYRNDFIEMGVLGRGGGGEVVKVRNRLDRRLYAIKKIELESETGKFASVAAIQNKKLRREVTTISRMLHKNIVRYYQAWVEGGEEIDAPSVGKDEGEEGKNFQRAQSNDDDESSEDEANDSGWWTNSPTDGVGEDLLARGNSSDGFSEHSSDGASWVAEDDDTIEMSNPRGVSNSASIQDLLGQEQDFQSPLLAGMGFQNQSYHGLFQKKKKESTSTSQSDDDLWDDSGVKIDPSSSNRVLYIQVMILYCSLIACTEFRGTFSLCAASFSLPFRCEMCRWSIVRQL
jgi:translation initiation factor 2-alpha kinase 4